MKKITPLIVALLIILFSINQTATAQISWTSSASAADNDWRAITYGNGLFVAVAITGTGNRIMTSPDGIFWTIRTSPADNSWVSVTYGNGLFVAVATNGTGNRVMTSTDGITWTIRNSAANNFWNSVTYGAGLFVAVAQSGTNRVMTSPDGVTWSIGTAAANYAWVTVIYAGGLFVAVAQSGVPGNRVMTSPDGITWTIRTAAADNIWRAIAYGSGLFVAVATSGTGNRVMTSPDGITWTIQTSAADYQWQSVTYGNGFFVAAASFGGILNRIMTSPDGITWTLQTSATDNSWFGVTYGSSLFVAVASSGTGIRVMTSGSFVLPLHWLSLNGNLNTSKQAEISWRVAEQNVTGYQVEKSRDAISFSSIGNITSKGNGENNYTFTEMQTLTGTAYYRVKQTDTDGKFTYSSIITLRNNNRHQISIYPNPIKDRVTVIVGNNLLNKNAVLADIHGKVLQAIKISGSSFTINVAGYPGGFYLLRIDNENPIKIIKE